MKNESKVKNLFLKHAIYSKYFFVTGMPELTALHIIK